MHYTYISWEYWTDEEIDFLSNWCWSSRWLFRPPLARKNRNSCNHHDVRYSVWGSIFDKIISDLILFIEIFADNFKHIWFYWLWNIYWIFMSFMYFIWVWIFWTIIDITMLLIFWKKSAFKFWIKKKKIDLIK